MPKRRIAMFSALALPLALLTLPALSSGASAATAPVAAMAAPAYQRVKPANSTNLVTPSAQEAAAAASTYGFTTDLGTPFTVSTAAAAGLTAVHRLYLAANGDFTWALEGSAQLSTAKSKGYADQGTTFYASPSDVGTETVPVDSYAKSGVHRLALSAPGAQLVAQGWSAEGTAFYVPAGATGPAPPPPPAPTTSAGSAAVGTTAYPVPSGAIYVALSGNDSSAGNAAAPVRTIGRALALAPAGGTVLVRAGTYNESLVIQSKTVTVQSYPNEAVWLDGSQQVSGWVADGASWRKDGWGTRFDHSPTYTQGAPDSTSPNWQFVNPNTYPMAAHPDQVFVDGTPLAQVKARSLVTAGSFFLDESTSKLYVGSNPSGHTVSASTTAKAMSIRSAGSVVRGIGIRRFSPSVYMMGAITIEAPRVRLENVIMLDSATTGISVLREDATLDRVTIDRSGMLGIHGRYADRLMLSSVSSTRNNAEHFNIAPVSGGAKLGQTRGVTVRDSSFSGNYGHGFWEDMSVYNTVVRGSDFMDNQGDGMFLEISAKAVVGDSFFARNKLAGIMVNNTSDVKIWNNTFIGDGRPVNLVQDSRRNNSPSNPAVDPRIAWPDPAMPWTLGPVTVRNNVVSQSTSGANCVLCVEDYSRQKTAEQMGITANGDVFRRPDASTPTWLVVWSRGATNAYIFTSLPQATATTGQERRGREFVGASIVDGAGTLTNSVASLASQVAEPLPSDVATLIGRPAGTLRLGMW